MGLDDLVGCIELLKERMQSYRTDLEENEIRTRAALIDPLLHALGWDVSDPAMVMPEYKIDNKPVDYALFRPNGKPAATLEAKKLGEPLNSHRMQMLNYANMAGIEYAGLTDGDYWELYKVFQPGRLEDRRVLEVSIADGPAHASALKLLLLWRPNLASGEPTLASTPIVDDRRPTPAQVQVEQATAPPPAASNWIALSEYNPPKGTPCPATIRLWDGSERPLTRWLEILTAVVEKLYAQRLFTANDAPLGWGRQTYRVHTKPVHPTGKPFVSPKTIKGTPLFVEVHLSAPDVRRQTRRLLKHHGLDPADVHLREAR